MDLLRGRKAVVFGVANEKSIAWAIAKSLHNNGAELAFTFAGEALEKRVRPLAESLGAKLILPCDVTKDTDIKSVFKQIQSGFGNLNILVHAVAFANKDDLKGSFLETSRDGFALAQDISAYSLTALARHAAPLMEGQP